MRYFLILYVLLFVSFHAVSQRYKTDANIIGHVVSEGEHLPFVTISVVGTTIGTTTDLTGHFRLLHLPVGTITIRAQSVGYQSQDKEITIKEDEFLELNFELLPDILGLSEVVVTGDRHEKNRKESSVIVNTITPKLFNVVNTVSLSDGLNFSPGLRMENNCQNCGFNQVRINGMEGSYSQILINGRPIFSGLAGVYGLELIPTSMLERIEVVRGGGSALYGSNAIAGTINLILRDPIRNTYEFGAGSGFYGTAMAGAGIPAQDYTVNANASLVSDDHKTGLAIYGFYRDRQPFDANNDGFSELVKLNNTTFGSRFTHRFGFRSKVAIDFFNIKENRRGGNHFDKPLHLADVAEALEHDITTGAFTFERFFRGTDLWSVYASGQQVLRNSYYGADLSLKDYGRTRGNTFVLGTTYSARFGKSNLTLGIEDRFETITDRKMGFHDWENALIEDGVISQIPIAPDTLVAMQRSNTLGIFGQYDIRFNDLTISAGGRFDNYIIGDEANSLLDKTGNVFSPRVTLKYDILSELQARASYSQGYRAPQLFDEDLHTEASSLRKVVHRNSPGLKQETSHSLMASLDFNKQMNKVYLGLLVEGFYTRLNNAFVSEFGEPDENGLVVYTRTNADGGAVVQGVNLEVNVVPDIPVSITSGYNWQSSRYTEPHEFGENRFFRTPNHYGYLTLDWNPTKRLSIASTSNYTGSMLVPYFGNQLDNPELGELRTTNPFFDMGVKVAYDFKVNGSILQLYGGVKNVFNSYQRDFDSGPDKDAGYVYGPGQPRTVYLGIKIGSL